MNTTIESLEFYLQLVNNQGNRQLKIYRANGTNYINTVVGNETIFNGTLNECYYFLVGAQKLVNPTFNDYTVNGTFRTFQIVDSHRRNYFCNLKDIKRVIDLNGLKSGYYTIYEFWNNKPKKCSKKHLNEMFEANCIDFKL